MLQSKAVKGVKFSKNSKLQFCEGCVLGKMNRTKTNKFSDPDKKAKKVCDKISSDVMGPFKVTSRNGYKWCVSYIDHYTEISSVYFLKNKGEQINAFKSFKAKIENQSGRKIKMFYCDGGGEYNSTEFNNLLIKSGIIKHSTAPYSPQQNGMAERWNRTVIEKARAMLLHAGLDYKFWADAVHTANFLRNRTPTNKNCNTTPYEKFFGHKPTAKFLRVFGSNCWALTPDNKRWKMEPKSKPFIFVGYSNTIKGYRVYDPNTNKEYVRRDVCFNESEIIKFPTIRDKNGNRFYSNKNKLKQEDLYFRPFPITDSGTGTESFDPDTFSGSDFDLDNEDHLPFNNSSDSNGENVLQKCRIKKFFIRRRSK